MSTENSTLAFEREWQTRLETNLERFLSPADVQLVLDGGELVNRESSSRERAVWTCEMFERLDEVADAEQIQEILTDCHCRYPDEDLLDVKMTYRVFGDIDQALALLQDKFEGFLREGLQLEESLVQEVVDRDWGLAGKRDGNRILVTKIPKSGSLIDYFQAEDPLEKRKLYCHCPRVREMVGEEPQLPKTYCYCGAGFYQDIWERILDQPVNVEVIKSVMAGDDVCQIAIHLPEM